MNETINLDLLKVPSLLLEEDYFEELPNNVWIMESHKWAYYIWESYRDKGNELPPVLVHLDFHWDAINDFNESKNISKLICIRNLEELKSMVDENYLIKPDSFIAPAIIRGFVKTIYFHCFQTDTEIGFDRHFLKANNAKQVIFSSIENLVKRVGRREIILDIDLDIFEKSENYGISELWTENEIIAYFQKCEYLIR